MGESQSKQGWTSKAKSLHERPELETIACRLTRLYTDDDMAALIQTLQS